MKPCNHEERAYEIGREGLGIDSLPCKCKACMKRYNEGRKDYFSEVEK